MEMKRRHHAEELIQRVVFDNPVQFLGQSANFKVTPRAREVSPAMA
jgi:hypothetical protein